MSEGSVKERTQNYYILAKAAEKGGEGVICTVVLSNMVSSEISLFVIVIVNNPRNMLCLIWESGLVVKIRERGYEEKKILHLYILYIYVSVEF